jgi:hypothetical protein
MTTALREVSDQIHGNGFPRSCGDRKRGKQTHWGLSRPLGSLADGTCGTEFAHKARHCWPPKVPAHCLFSRCRTQVTMVRNPVTLMDHALSHRPWGHIDLMSRRVQQFPFKMKSAIPNQRRNRVISGVALPDESQQVPPQGAGQQPPTASLPDGSKHQPQNYPNPECI